MTDFTTGELHVRILALVIGVNLQFSATDGFRVYAINEAIIRGAGPHPRENYLALWCFYPPFHNNKGVERVGQP
jgi:hypothetical protein